MADEKLYEILTQVEKPSRYIGAEVNACMKDPEKMRLRVALCFPDVYEIGMSHLGLKILYEALNSRADVFAERAYSPWPDLEKKLWEGGLPLPTTETATPLSSMDVVGFTLQYELSYTNVVNMLDLAGLPVMARERGDGHPLVIAGGPCAYNPEPLAAFIDAFVIGDSEEAILEIADAVIAHKEAHKEAGQAGGRARLLLELAKIQGVYVPSHFEVAKTEGGRITGIRNIAGGPDRVKKRVLENLDDAPYPDRPVLPYTAAVHNRVTLEVARGCTHGCRFCQAGYTYRPLRERTPDKVIALAETSVCATGYDELSLSSLSTGDYSQLLPLMKELMDRFESRRVSISLPSLRVGTLTPEMCREIKRVRKTGFTIAPEAGTERLRAVINKDITEEALLSTAETVFAEGWDLIKLYFMTGLPTETDEDIEGIIRLSRKVLDAGRKAGGGKSGGRKKKVNVGVSAFVPKPHTPFERLGQVPLPEILRKKAKLAGVLGKKPFALKSGLAEMSVLEAALARGGRECSAAVLKAWEAGARFDSWTDFFSYETWTKAFTDAGLDLGAEAERNYSPDEGLPWDHIDTGLTAKFLKKEFEKALKGEITKDCRVKCTSCGLKCEANAPDTPPPSARRKRADRSPLSSLPPARVRFLYTKLKPLSLLSHTELMSLFFKAILRAELPVKYSEGFNPHMKVSFGPALAVGIESEAEILDIELSYAIDLQNAVKALNRALPDGVLITRAEGLMPGAPAAGAGLSEFSYEATAPAGFSGNLEETVEAFMSSGRAAVTRKSGKGDKEIDIRPMVKELSATAECRIAFTLKTKDGKNAKPFELIQALFGLTVDESRAVRVVRKRMS